jgi:hypothetical protein
LAASSIPNYPEELLWNGRQPDQTFDANEFLFYRVTALDERGKVGSVDVMCPNTSVNRGKYSRPIHVLYARLPRFLNWRVVEFRVGEIPGELEHPDGRKFQFKIVHDPVQPLSNPMRTMPTRRLGRSTISSQVRGCRVWLTSFLGSSSLTACGPCPLKDLPRKPARRSSLPPSVPSI